MSKYSETAYRLFRGYTKYFEQYFIETRGDLRKAGIRLIVEEYIAVALLTSLIAAFGAYIISVFVLMIILKNPAIAFVAPLSISGLIAIIIFFVFYVYPSQIVEARKKRIDNAIHYMVIYMQTLAGTGVPPQRLFKMMAEFKEFGEISRLCEGIYRDINIFGLSLGDAISRAAERSPSTSFQELLWGIKSNIESGGNLKSYLEQKGLTYVEDYRRRLQEFVKTLSIFMEMYITVVVVGSVFVLILTTIMSLLGGYVEQIQAIQYMIVCLGLPFVSIAFILFLKISSPTEV